MTSGNGTHTLVPDDIATIYDIAPLYSAGINGSGQSLAVMGQTNINVSDINAFRSTYGLPAINLVQVPAQRTQPGISSGDLPEADLDLEWSGAVARNATIYYVYSDDVFTSAFYAVTEKTAPVMTISYGTCEPSDLVDIPSIQQLAQQANAEGITWFAAAGDEGAADCDNGATVAQNGLAVDWPASIPEITGMGGSEFNEQGANYWSSTNSATGASALGYIPEMVWNDTSIDGVLSAGGGGASVVFSKPIWQTGRGVPGDGARDVPDLSFAASADHDGYHVVTGGQNSIFGGTSVAAPMMAGITTLLNQYLVQNGAISQPGLANINPTLYRLAQAPNASEIFHDIVTGNNIVPCAPGTPNCSGGSLGYSAQASYDQASGLGSLDVNNFVHGWSTAQPAPAAAVVPSISTTNCITYASTQECSSNPLFEDNGSWQFQVTLTEEAGVAATLTNFTIDGASYTAQITSLFGSASIPARGSITATITLTGVAAPKNVVFVFGGTDAAGNNWSTQMSVAFEGTQTAMMVGGANNAASGQNVYAPGMLMAIYGTALGNFVQSAAAIPLPAIPGRFRSDDQRQPVPDLLRLAQPGERADSVRDHARSGHPAGGEPVPERHLGFHRVAKRARHFHVHGRHCESVAHRDARPANLSVHHR